MKRSEKAPSRGYSAACPLIRVIKPFGEGADSPRVQRTRCRIGGGPWIVADVVISC